MHKCSQLFRSDGVELAAVLKTERHNSTGRTAVGGAAIPNPTGEPIGSIRILSNFCLWGGKPKRFRFRIRCLSQRAINFTVNPVRIGQFRAELVPTFTGKPCKVKVFW